MMADEAVRTIRAAMDTLRAQCGRRLHVALGRRATFAHNADLDLPDKLITVGGRIWPDIAAEECWPFHEHRHHPFLLLCGHTGQCTLDSITILPDETYEILQDGDDEVVRACPIDPARDRPAAVVYPPLTRAQVTQYIELAHVKSEYQAALYALVA
jgi:hypothetical protein